MPLPTTLVFKFCERLESNYKKKNEDKILKTRRDNNLTNESMTLIQKRMGNFALMYLLSVDQTRQALSLFYSFFQLRFFFFFFFFFVQNFASLGQVVFSFTNSTSHTHSTMLTEVGNYVFIFFIAVP